MIFDLLDTIGGCVVYHDYRSGSYRDWSGNGNDGTPTGAGLARDGADFVQANSIVTVPYKAGLDLGNGSALSVVMLFPDDEARLRPGARWCLSQSSGVRLLFSSTGTVIYFYVAGVYSTIGSFAWSKGLSFDWTAGAAPNRYSDGVLSGVGASTLAAGSDTSDILIGGAGSNSVNQTMSAIALFNKALSATEHSELYGALAATRWPTKVYSHARPDLAVDRDETGLVAGYDMRPVAGKVFDASGNGHDGTITGQVYEAGGLVNTGENDIDTGVTATELNPRTQSHTVSCWVRQDAYPASLSAPIGKGAGNSGYTRPPNGGVYSDGSSYFNYAHYNGSGYVTIPTLAIVSNGLLYHVVYVVDRTNGLISFYLNGVLQGTKTDLVFIESASIDADGFRVFGFNSSLASASVEGFKGAVYQAKIYDTAKDQTWVSAEYARGARAGFSTRWGARETSANVTTGPISNTPFEVATGAFKVVTDTIDGTPVKAIECVTAGTVYMPVGLFKSDFARGTFDFRFYKSQTSSVVRAQVISNQPTVETDASFDGYALRLETNNVVSLYRRISGAGFAMQATAAGYAPVGEWSRYTITVGNGNVFTTYLNGALIDVSGGSGTNPVTDTTHTESKYLVFDLDAGDMVALGAVDGSYGITKRIGVEIDGI